MSKRGADIVICAFLVLWNTMMNSRCGQKKRLDFMYGSNLLMGSELWLFKSEFF